MSYDVDKKQLRAKYLKAINHESVEDLIYFISSGNMNDPLILGYHTAGSLMLTEYKDNPIKKIKNFKTYSNRLDSLIGTNERIIELRLLRYAIQMNAPDFLKYNRQIYSDRTYIENNKKGEPSELQEFIKKVLKLVKNK